MDFKLPFLKEQKPAAFELHRIEDDSGISGTGHVLDGVVFPDGTTVVRWRGKNRSTAVFKTYRQFEKIHMAYHGTSEIKWVNGFNGLEFAYNYLSLVGLELSKVYNETTTANKYIIAKLRQIVTMKAKELGELRHAKEISIRQDRGRSQTSLSRTGISTDTLTRPPKGDELSTETK